MDTKILSPFIDMPNLRFGTGRECSSSAASCQCGHNLSSARHNYTWFTWLDTRSGEYALEIPGKLNGLARKRLPAKADKSQCFSVSFREAFKDLVKEYAWQFWQWPIW